MADRYVIGGAPIRVYLVKQFRRERAAVHGLLLSNGAELEDADDGPRDHELLVGADDPHLHAAGVPRNQRRILRIALRIEFDAEEAESVADPRPDERRVFADASCEDERVQSTERRGEGADPLLRLIAKQRHGGGVRREWRR